MLGPRVCFDGPSLCNNHGVQYRGAGASILTGVGRAISHIFESGGWRIGHFGLHIFDRLLLVVALGIPVMPIVNRDYLKLVLLYHSMFM